MTLILTCATPRFVVQVSDRLVTRGGKAFDPASNKAVIYQAENATVAIGYSGLAHIEGLPTDQWIAEKLRYAGSLNPIPEPQPRLELGRVEHHMDLGQSLSMLRTECERVYRSMPSNQRERLQISIGGWQLRRRGHRFTARPILHLLENGLDAPHRSDFKEKALPRYWHYSRDGDLYLVTIPDGHFTTAQRKQFFAEVRCVRNATSLTDLMVATVRNVAQRVTDLVGGDCMVILMPPPSSQAINAKYVPGGLNGESMGPAFSPWVVGQYLASPPAEIVGGWKIGLGVVEVCIEGSQATQSKSAWPDSFPKPSEEMKSIIPQNAEVLASFKPQKRRHYP